MNRALRLGPIPKTATVKLTIRLSPELKATLDRYAELHSREWGQAVNTALLVPHMLQAFIAQDRTFQRVVRNQA